ncbi:MAG TPA: hypothetical protein DEQ14_10105 [Treponema sp.]|nr:hypothetical protein [Treponema sp.]
MSRNSALRAGLFLFECFRCSYLITFFIISKPGAGTAFPWLIYAVPNALFPLMLLFLWLDFPKYRVYEPLYISGKCVSFFTIAGWYLFAPSAGDMALSPLARVMTTLVISDLFTIIFAVLISRMNKKDSQAAIPAKTDTETNCAGESETSGQEGI